MNQGESVDVAKDPKTYTIIGAAMEVHRELGSGFLEAVYQKALALEFIARGISHRSEVELPVSYKGQRLDVSYRADFICYDTIVVELKALARLSGVEESQLINYLKATGIETGLLVNFGAKSLEYRRFTAKPVSSPQITPITEDSVGSRKDGLNPQITPITEDSGVSSAEAKRNLCKSVESVDRTPNSPHLESVDHD